MRRWRALPLAIKWFQFHSIKARFFGLDFVSFLRKLLEDNKITVGHVSVQSSRAAELANAVIIHPTKASILNKALTGTGDFEAALPAKSQYRKTELDPITNQLVYPFHALMEQLTKQTFSYSNVQTEIWP